YTPAVEDENAVYWIRPSDGTSEGTPSLPDGGNVVLLTPETTVLGPETGIEFSLQIDPDTLELLDPPGGGADVEPGQILVGVYEDIALGEFHGVMDRVLSIDSRLGDLVTVTTEPATFKDVFQQAGFSKTADMLNPALLDLVTKYPCATPTATTIREIGPDGKPLGVVSANGSVARPGGLSPAQGKTERSEAELGASTGPRFRTISADAARSLEQQRLSAKRTSADNDISLDFSGARLYDKTDGANYLRVYVEQGTFDWNLPGVDVDYDVGVDWCWFVPCGISVHHVKAGVSGGVASDLVVKAEGKWDKEINEESKLYELSDYYVFALGPVPVVMRVTVAIYGGITGEAHADLFAKAGYHMNYGLAMGVIYDGDNWGTYFEPTANFSPEPPEFNANGSADLFAYLRGEVTIAFYDVAGGRVFLTPGLQGHADGSVDIPAGEYCLNWNLDGRLRGDLNLFAQIFGISIFDETWNIFDINTPIAGGTIGCGGPASSSPNMYFNGTTGVGFLPHTVTYSAGDESLNPASDTFDPDSFINDGPMLKQGIKAYYWDLDGDGFCEQMTHGDMPTAQHTYNAYGDFNVSLWAVDDDGMIAQKTILANIQEPPI
ncbi:MAG: PKD domain-containing protein, partial [bacterium]|nr:PKD domain-containing protein [bacterium]